MADSWSGESGILRKTKPCEADELLVFGYSCKLFRDDEKALLIDQGKHLIPWMGDESLKIDRYDGRGALFDLGRYEAPPGGFSTHWTGLSEDEQRAEQLCDEERYQALYHNESEEELYREEELKRLHQDYAGTYGQVPYSYDGQNDQDTAETSNEELSTEDNQPFVPPAHLDIPVNMVLPDTVKLNAIIEKTAMFINQQGTQMEILLKAKQKDNPQFEFLNHDCPLYRYYRHLLMAMKTGRYKPAVEEAPEEEPHLEEEESSDYLHPSLATNFTKPDLLPPPRPLPPIVYKPSANCAYSMLVNKIKGTSNNIPEPVNQEEKSNASDQQTANYDNYYYSEEYRQYYMQYYMHHYANNMEISRAPVIYNKDAAHEHNGLQETYDPEKPTTSEHVMIGPQIPTTANSNKTTNSSEKKSADKDATLKNIQNFKDDKTSENSKKRKIVIGALAQYCNSDSESEEEEEESTNVVSKENPGTNDSSKNNTKAIIIPSDDTKIIIHKMASYVAKNGREFEQIVSAKGDPRFKFLQSYHEHYPYYLQKLRGYLGPEKVLDNNNVSNNTETVKNSQKVQNSKPKVIGPVSFSIKKTKDTETLPLKPALPVESSSDEDAEKKDASENVNAESQSTENDITKVESEQDSDVEKPSASTMEDETNKVDDKINNEEASTTDSYTEEITISEHKGIMEDESPISDNKDTEQDDDVVEISSEEMLESKPIENKLREKLTAMQDKSIKNKDKQLQLERKKRAMAFLNQLKATSDIPKQICVEHSEEQRIISYDSNSSDSNISLIEKLDSPRVNNSEQLQNTASKRRSRTRSRSRSQRREKKKSRKRSNSRSSIEYSPKRHRDGREKSRKSKKKSRSHSHDTKRSSKKRSKNHADNY